MKYFIKTYGCQMNEYDSERLATTIKSMGYELSENYEEVELVILNTCSIREKATHKIYSELGRINKEKNKMKKNGKYMIIVLTGCVPETEKDLIFKNAPYVDISIGPQSYHKLKDMIMQIKSGVKFDKKGKLIATVKHLTHLEFSATEKFDFLDEERKEFNGVSAFISIQEGCNKFCTYCVVPNTRGREVNRNNESILREIEQVGKLGVKEVTLLGQNVNSYKFKDNQNKIHSIADLINEISLMKDIERIKYTTSHPRDFSEDLIIAHRDCKKLMPYLHLPVQSGSDKVLKKMNRKYTAESYIKLIKELKKVNPKLIFSSDFIVGFPEETEDDFEQTLHLIDEVQYKAQSYSFSYSKRPYTVAAIMQNQIPDDVKQKRLLILQAKLEKQRMEFNESCVGSILYVLFDNKNMKNELQLGGRSEFTQITIVNCKNEAEKEYLYGKIIPVKITTAKGIILQGDVIL